MHLLQLLLFLLLAAQSSQQLVLAPELSRAASQFEQWRLSLAASTVPPKLVLPLFLLSERLPTGHAVQGSTSQSRSASKRPLSQATEYVERWRQKLALPPGKFVSRVHRYLPGLDFSPKIFKLPAMPDRGGSAGDALIFVADRVSSGNGWRLVLDRDGVRVWRRAVKGNPNDEIRANGIINAPPRAVIRLLREPDEEIIRMYNPMYDSGYDLEQLDANTKVSYGSVRPIRPFKPRDTVTRVAFKELPRLYPAGGTAIIQNAVEHKGMPRRAGYVRAKIIRGLLLVQAMPGRPSMTNFTFTTQVDVGGSLPAWLMNILTTQDAVKFVKRVGATARGQRTREQSK